MLGSLHISPRGSGIRLFFGHLFFILLGSCISFSFMRRGDDFTFFFVVVGIRLVYFFFPLSGRFV